MKAAAHHVLTVFISLLRKTQNNLISWIVSYGLLFSSITFANPTIFPIIGQLAQQASKVASVVTTGGCSLICLDGTVAGGNAIASAVAVDSTGNIYVVGSTITGLDGQSQKGTTDFFVTKYNSSGIWQWTVQDGNTGGTSVANGVAIDSSGNIYVAGYTTVGVGGQANLSHPSTDSTE